MSIMEQYYCAVKRSNLMNGRGRLISATQVLPPYLTNSEIVVRAPGRPKTFCYSLTSPHLQGRHSVGRKNLNRKMSWYIQDQKKVCVNDEDGNFWFRGKLEAEKLEASLKNATADSGIGNSSLEQIIEENEEGEEKDEKKETNVDSYADGTITEECGDFEQPISIANIKYIRKRVVRNWSY